MKLIFKIVPDDYKQKDDDVVVQIRFGDNFDSWNKMFYDIFVHQLVRRGIGIDVNHNFQKTDVYQRLCEEGKRGLR
jgi:hypothetical protein